MPPPDALLRPMRLAMRWMTSDDTRKTDGVRHCRVLYSVVTARVHVSCSADHPIRACALAAAAAMLHQCTRVVPRW